MIAWSCEICLAPAIILEISLQWLRCVRAKREVTSPSNHNEPLKITPITTMLPPARVPLNPIILVSRFSTEIAIFP
jgi:hypothetical protein